MHILQMNQYSTVVRIRCCSWLRACKLPLTIYCSILTRQIQKTVSYVFAALTESNGLNVLLISKHNKFNVSLKCHRSIYLVFTKQHSRNDT